MQYTNQQVEFYWEKACLELRLKLSPAVFSTWISTNPATFIEESETITTVKITCPTAFHAANLEKNLNNQVCEALETALEKKVKIIYQVGESTELSSNNKIREAILNTPRRSDRIQPPPDSSSGQELFSNNSLQAAETDRVQWRAHQIGLNPQFSFTTFAVSTSNEMAHAAAVSVAKNPSGAYNPLFLYGDVGVGKTHLMHAIGNEILLGHPDTKMIYCTGEDFTNEIVAAIQTKKASSFKYKYRSASVLFLDDIQFIAGKNAVQEEFFHTFNALIKQNAQIVLTSDRPPSEISLLENRLRSRFEAGLMIDIGRPTFELRTAILLHKAKQAQINLNIEMAKFIATKITSAREIEGFVARLRSQIELNKKPISDQLIQELLEKNQKRQKRLSVSPSQVITVVAKYYGLKTNEMRGKSRLKNLVGPRHTAMYILNQDLGLPLTEIARWFSHRDHTSVLHGVKKKQEELLDNHALQQELSELRSKLEG